MAILAEEIEDKIPGWMRRLSFLHWRDLAGAIALVIDAVIDGLYDGRYASWPGQVDVPGVPGTGTWDSPEALPLIGRDRGIVKGPNNSPAEYAGRLREWRQTWKTAGTALGILGQLHGALGPTPPRIRIVTGWGVWCTLESDGTFILNNTTGTGFQINPDGTTAAESGVAHPWDWDSFYVSFAPLRLWVIIYAPTLPPLNDTEGVWETGSTTYDPPSLDTTQGTTASYTYVELVRSVIADFKPAGVKVDHIIIAFDPASFDPLTAGPYPAAGMPDGKWLHHGKIVIVGGHQRRVSARNLTARYWRGTA